MTVQHMNNSSKTSQHEQLHPLTHANAEVQASPPILALQVGYHLDPGITRKDQPNEDTLYVMHRTLLAPAPSTPFVLLLLADGMGGHEQGQVASQLAVQSLVDFMLGSPCWQQPSPESLLSLLREGVQSANRVVYQRNQQQQTSMGTTMTAVLVLESTAYVAHVGNSRLYLYRHPAGLVQITRDQSVVAALVTAGRLAPEDLSTHAWRKQLYRSLGEEASVVVDTSAVPLAADDVLLVCSDGLWEMVRDPHLASILTRPLPTPTDTAHALIQAALAGGGEDNVSVIVAQVSNSKGW